MIQKFPSHTTRLFCDADVVVIGAGSAGCCAAIAAAEAGRRVALLDRLPFAGGTSTAVLDTFYGFYTPGDAPRKVVGGVPDRVVDELDACGEVFLRPNTYGAGTGVTYNPERLKWVWERLLDEAKVQLLLHTTLVDVEKGTDNELRALIVHTRSGFGRVTGRRFIDASGDAELCHILGVPYEKAGDKVPAQTLTTTFRMAGVDLNRFEAAGGKKMLEQKMAEAVDRGTHALSRRAGSLHPMTIDGCVASVAVRVADLDPTDSEQLTAAEIEGRRQTFVYEGFLRAEVAGYERARVVATSAPIGIRETRRVYGRYRLTRSDCLSGRSFEDRVLICGAPIEDHRPARPGEPETDWAYVKGGGTYDVPYRCLVTESFGQIWVAGRCFSATHDAHASCRSMGQTMSMGQAAGVAAAQSLNRDCGAADVEIEPLQQRLRDLGAVLERPGTLADTSEGGWSRSGKARA
ncbi:MAG: FAD-dependent oxidoreductase [Phycisphaeraceae bacterium]|nr:FAD-dependent oxidoreductase [Phycisphaeraceae bacterium]